MTLGQATVDFYAEVFKLVKQHLERGAGHDQLAIALQALAIGLMGEMLPPLIKHAHQSGVQVAGIVPPFNGKPRIVQ